MGVVAGVSPSSSGSAAPALAQRELAPKLSSLTRTSTRMFWPG